MVCGQVPRCRRLCRPRPFLLALVVALCLFCQTLTPLMSSSILSAVVNGIAPNKLTKTQQGRYKEVSPSTIHCFLPGSNSETVKKIDVSILQYFGSHTRRAVLYAPAAHHETDRQLCQRILAKHGYTVTVLENRRLVEDLRHEGPYHSGMTPWDLFICLSSRRNDGTGCFQTEDLRNIEHFQKVNLLPEIQHFLCRKEGLCQITKAFSDLQLPLVTPDCSGQPGLSKASTARNVSQGSTLTEQARASHPQHWWKQSMSTKLNQVSTTSDHKDILKAQDLSVIIKAYVLVTSLTPLRAFIHSTTTVWHPPKKKHFTIKLKRFFEIFFRNSSPQQAFNNMKEAINKLLLITEVFSKSSASGPNSFNQCSQCFQMLTFDIGFSMSIHPVVLKVHENFDFQVENESTIQDQISKELLFEDTFKFLLSNESSTSSFIEALQKIYGSSVTKDGTYNREDEQCFSLEQINSMITFIKELKSLGPFELLFPSSAPKIQMLLQDLYRMVDPMRRLNSVLTVHWLLSSVLQQFQFMNKEAHTNLSEWQLSQENMSPKQNVPSDFRKNHEALHYSSKTGERQCSYDKDTLSHIRQIFTSPQLDLNPQFNPKIREYYAEVPFDMVTVKIGAEPSNCQCHVHLDDKNGPSNANYPLGLGLNKVIILLMDDSQPSPEVVSSYRITIYREDRPSLPLFDDYMMCGFVQDCASKIRPEESCGLQPLSHEYLSAISQTVFKTCETGDTKGQWIVPCLSCSDNRTCDWREITWQPHGCRYSVLAKPELQRCVEGRRILFIGDSTNRGMMYYLIERVNKTLQEWQKTHDVKCYHNINEGKTFISYSYYPQFWMNANQRPTFEKALEQLLQRSRPLENTDQTVLIVGGVQWLNSNHLQIIQKVLNRENLSNILVIVKSIGMGFHLPVDGIHSLSQAEVQNLWNENLIILDTAKNLGYEVVDTFVITMGRYKEFLQGKCGCHFHEVVKSNPSEERPHITMTLSRHYTLGKYFGSQSKPSQLQDYTTNSQSPYHVRGPINQVYSEILLSRLCANKREFVST
ncbi:cadherin-like and PC-esterase domain-containing protein 1 isoform X1 [Parus major]|uniref:cadherin-like and PC-esterase domain-containing protein 1 isoform X1 n=2 Tax=Parus major TaxID=9157 RepID=UPI000771451C|nr:cadherin-like and PC-esterase domain-containing protein 1 isoform X1 [Parus major]XP_033370384.1 cadherin-like and PC-esterase domain-containing protein 1 isoform X1 [Parus major]XP_033370385.1 cadherin-like and PC-esterase domain-containing protein 1 isoform X1 [Parus major]XP_033370386.1 cadherin-like and PC-esterase domain-containing protein 1 isoform X1 [Parus major]